MQRNAKDSVPGLVVLAVIGFASRGVGWILLQVEPQLFGFPRPVWGLVQYATHWSTTIAVWLLIAMALVARARSASQFDIFAARRWPDRRQWLLAVILVFGSVLLSLWRFDRQPYFVYEFTLSAQTYASFPILAFGFQMAYRAFQGVILLLAVAFTQEAGNRATGDPRIPWGAIAAAILWGATQWIAAGMQAGLFTAAKCYLMGAAYHACGRNLRVAFPLILVMAWC